MTALLEVPEDIVGHATEKIWIADEKAYHSLDWGEEDIKTKRPISIQLQLKQKGADEARVDKPKQNNIDQRGAELEEANQKLTQKVLQNTKNTDVKL